MCTTKLLYLKVPVTRLLNPSQSGKSVIKAAMAGVLLSLLSAVAIAQDGETLAEFKPVLSEEFKAALKNANLAAGEKYFDRKCATCHDAKENGQHNMGPHLWGWFGRQAATLDGFEYSSPMKESGHVWDFATLNYYLQNTERAVPGKIMNFRGIKSDKSRANLLVYLATFNPEVPQIPE